MQGETGSVLGPPPDVGARRPSYDPDWYEKIERAKQARELGEELQKSARKHKNIHGNARKHDFREKNSPVRGVPFQPLQARR